MDRLVAISKASEVLGVSITTLRRWETEGKLIPERTAPKLPVPGVLPITGR
jgi:predicted site-specific integrase-resolvase